MTTITNRRSIRTRDKARPPPGIIKARKLEKGYAVQLRKIARHIGDIVRTFPVGDPAALPQLEDALNRYAVAIDPWARAASGTMIAEVSRRDETAWSEIAKGMSRALRQEIQSAPTGVAMRAMLEEQTALITSLPRDAADRVRKLTLEGLTDSTRASEIAAEIMRSGEVSTSRANLIARTEVSRTASVLTQVRAEHVGSTAYVWRSAEDSDVRPSHKKMNGKTILWSDPPTLDGMKGHAGCLPNCRCYAEPVIPN